MKKIHLFESALCCIMTISAIGTTAFAHTQLSTVNHSPSETHWDIFEQGYTMPSGTSIPYHSSGNGIIVKSNPELINSSYFTNIDSCVTHAVNAWTSGTFNGTSIFSGKIRKASSDYTLSSSEISNQKTLVEIFPVYNTGKRFWGSAHINTDSAEYYSPTNSGQHLKYCKVVLNEATLGTTSSAYKQTYQKYTLTHELGHVIGLADLSSGNLDDETYSNYLMGYNNWTMQYPTVTDMKGAAVISGRHTNHSFNSYYSKINASKHRNVCSLCDGYKTENHSYSTYCCGILGKTTKLVICKCGYATTNSTTSFAAPSLSSASNYKVVDGPLTIRTNASTAASSNGTMSNGQTVLISEIKLATNNSNYVMGKISSGTYAGKWIALGTVSGDVYAVNMSKRLIVLDGPLTVRNTASSSAQSYGTISNGSTFYITDATAANGFIFGKISSSAPVVVSTDSTCSPNDASSHWVALDYCGSIW